MSRHRAIVLASSRTYCQPCNGTGVMTLVDSWIDDVTTPQRITCPHCNFPYLVIHTYPRRSA